MPTISYLKSIQIPILLGLVSAIFYTSFAYDLQRTDYSKLILLYGGLFFLFYKLLQLVKNDFKFLVFLTILFRVLFLFSIPNLSQDFYRFILDGRMILEGFNPYLYTVDSFIQNAQLPVNQAIELHEGMGALSASHYTNYPPINQLCFVIAGLFSGNNILGSVVVMRLLIIIADIGILFFGKKLLANLNLPVHHIFWYLLNPFIIIELTGNLHFEAVMIFFLIWALYLLQKGRWKLAAAIFALSISVKLIPLIFLPVFFQYFIQKKHPFSNDQITSGTLISRLLRLTSFYLIILLVVVILFLPFLSTKFISNYSETVGLWFRNFEFNASIYYLARAYGYTFRGFNEIAVIGKIIPIVVLSFTLLVTFFRKNKTSVQLITAMLFVLTFYYFTATTVHPWYLATPLILSIFTRYKFPLVWSLIIIISYLAYANTNNTENLWIIAFEYIVVYGVLLWEVFKKKPKLLLD